MNDQNKNMILAIVLSMLVLVGWTYFFPPVVPDENPVAVTQVDGAVSVPGVDGAAIAVTPAIPQSPSEARETALAETARIDIKTASLQGSISLLGGRIDDLHLSNYNVELNDPSEKVVLLSPATSDDPYYAWYGWAPAGGIDAALLPGATTVWDIESGTTLTETTPVNLVWDNGAGLIFRRAISVDEKYMFAITQSVENNTGSSVAMFPYGIIARQGEPETLGFYLLHEGIVRFVDSELEEIDYNDMPDQTFDQNEQGNVDKIKVESSGWTGMTDKYWMTTLIPQKGQPFTSVSRFIPASDHYQAEARLPVMQIAAGQSAEVTTSLFAGAKEVATIQAYEENNDIENFVDSVDWGMFFFLTKPIFFLLSFIHGLVGNMGWAIIGLTFTIKAMLFPLAYKSYVSMSKMKKLQPELTILKEKVGDDKAKLQKEMMALYKKEKVNPMSGCLPIFLQMPIFFSLYKVLFVTIEMRHAPFIGWIHDLSAPDPTSWMNLFGAIPFTVPEFLGILSIGVFPILMGVTMWMQQRLNPAPADKTQQMIFAWMPWVFMFMLGRFASGLVIYWVANNTITFTQQYVIMRTQGVKPDVFGNIISSIKRTKSED